MNNKEHATAILSKLLFRERVKIDGEYDYLTDTEICEKIILDYLNDKYPPAFSNVSGQVCAECKRKDEIIKWSRFYTDLRDKVNCIHCEEIIPCEECKTYKKLLKEHKLDTAQN